MNVAGLPELLSSGDPAVNTPLISVRLAPYNVINVEEDFNYHAALYADDTHPYRTPTSGGVPFGSGLNTLSDFEYLDLERTTWDDCDSNNGDCLTPKGFTYMRVRVSDGMWFDLYNLHTDAGSDDGDRIARQSNIQQVIDYIPTWSAGMPIVVMGDTNSRYTNAVDGASLHNLIDSAGVVDAWVSNIRGGSFPAAGTDALVCAFPFADGTTQAQMVACEVVDKIFVRSGTATTLTTTTFTNENDAFVDDTGAPLSDHYPISATASWKLSSALRMADPVGGPHGTPFNDLASALTTSAVPKITSITIRGGNRVDAVSYTLSYPSGSSSTITHGGTGGTANTLSLASGEYITKVLGCSAEYNGDTRVFYLQLTTNLGNVVSAGKTTSDCLTTTVPSDAGSGGSWGLVGFWGRSGDEADRLGAIWGAAY
ncbi:mannose-binding lectin [Hymenopellis radicata]|nr:mannose-binding lectin [Hymenopellis radicata]